jgi:hypothetical protein
MAKAMSIAGLVVGAMIALAFLGDLVLSVPFGGRQPIMAIGFIVSGALLCYLSWNALREAK